MKTKELYKIFKFLIVGVLNTAVDVLAFQAAHVLFGIDEYVSATISFLLSMANSYILNKAWTFSAKEQKTSAKRVFRFAAVNLLSLLCTYICLFVFLDLLSLPIFIEAVLIKNNIHIEFAKNYGAVFCKLLAFPFSILINYLGNRFWVFGREDK